MPSEFTLSVGANRAFPRLGLDVRRATADRAPPRGLLCFFNHNVSACTVSCRHAARAGEIFASTQSFFWLISKACALMSRLVTHCAPRRARHRPKSRRKTESVQNYFFAARSFSTSARFSRWSRKNPVFLSAQNIGFKANAVLGENHGTFRCGTKSTSARRDAEIAFSAVCLKSPAQAQDDVCSHEIFSLNSASISSSRGSHAAE